MDLPASIGRYQLSQTNYVIPLEQYNNYRELEIELVQNVTHPEFYTEGSILNDFTDRVEGVFTIARSEEVYLKDVLERFFTNQVLFLEILRCTPGSLPMG